MTIANGKAYYLRLDDATAQRVRQNAQRLGLSMSAYMRAIVKAGAEQNALNIKPLDLRALQEPAGEARPRVAISLPDQPQSGF